MNNYCKQNNKIVYKEYIDAGISGKSIEDRPQIKELLKDSIEGKFNEVIVWKLSRLSRKVNDLSGILEKFNKYNIIFRSYSEGFETETSTGKLLFNLLGSIGEFERDTILDNVKLGMNRRAREGKWNGGIVLGYNSIKISTDIKSKDNTLKVVPEEALIIQKIFTLYANGKGLKAIANQLNHEGYKTKRNNFFSTISIKDILHNPIYIGKIQFNKYNSNDYIYVDGTHEPIISTELWDKVHSLYKVKSIRPAKTFEGTFPLTGLMKCPVCGASMVSYISKNTKKDGSHSIYRYYVCNKWKQKGTAACTSNILRADYAEAYIFNKLQDVLFNPKILNDLVENINSKRQNLIKPLRKELSIINKKITNNDTKNAKYFDLYIDNIISKEVLSQKLHELDTEKESLVQRKSTIEDELDNQNTDCIPYKFVENVLSNFQSSLKNAPPEKQKSLLHLIIKEIIITKDKKIEKVNLKFDEHIQRHFIKNETEESSTDEDSSFISRHNQKIPPYKKVRFTLPYSKF